MIVQEGWNLSLSFEMVVALISVLGTVLIATINVILPAKMEKWRSKRERRKECEIRINQTALDLLGELANFRHWKMQDIINASGQDSILKCYTFLEKVHYAWEREIWSSLNNADKNLVRELRKIFHNVHTPTDITKGPNDSDIPELTEEILQVTSRAIQNLKLD